MTTKALSLVEEFIRSPQPQLRKNALTALAVINEPQAIELMIRVALEDSDAGVRQRAEDELFELNIPRNAVELALTRVESPDEETKQRAYAFLGRLRSKGARGDLLMSIRWRDRLKLAARMNAYLYPKRSWRLRLRLWKPGLIGILLGSVFPVAFALRFLLKLEPLERADRIFQLSLSLALLVVLGIVLIVFAGHRTTPIYRHPNRFAAGVVETATTGFLGLVAVTPIFVLVLIWQWLDQGFSLGSLFIPLAGLMVGFVRAGTILSFGINSARGANRIVEVLGGAAIGSLAFVLVILLIFFASDYPAHAFVWLVAAWLVHLPLAFGGANAFASVDKEALPNNVFVILDRWRRLRVVILLAAFLFSVGVNIWTVRRMSSPPSRPNDYSGGSRG